MRLSFKIAFLAIIFICFNSVIAQECQINIIACFVEIASSDPGQEAGCKGEIEIDGCPTTIEEFKYFDLKIGQGDVNFIDLPFSEGLSVGLSAFETFLMFFKKETSDPGEECQEKHFKMPLTGVCVPLYDFDNPFSDIDFDDEFIKNFSIDGYMQWDIETVDRYLALKGDEIVYAYNRIPNIDDIAFIRHKGEDNGIHWGGSGLIDFLTKEMGKSFGGDIIQIPYDPNNIIEPALSARVVYDANDWSINARAFVKCARTFNVGDFIGGFLPFFSLSIPIVTNEGYPISAGQITDFDDSEEKLCAMIVIDTDDKGYLTKMSNPLVWEVVDFKPAVGDITITNSKKVYSVNQTIEFNSQLTELQGEEVDIKWLIENNDEIILGNDNSISYKETFYESFSHKFDKEGVYTVEICVSESGFESVCKDQEIEIKSVAEEFDPGTVVLSIAPIAEPENLDELIILNTGYLLAALHGGRSELIKARFSDGLESIIWTHMVANGTETSITETKDQWSAASNVISKTFTLINTGMHEIKACGIFKTGVEVCTAKRYNVIHMSHVSHVPECKIEYNDFLGYWMFEGGGSYGTNELDVRLGECGELWVYVDNGYYDYSHTTVKYGYVNKFIELSDRNISTDFTGLWTSGDLTQHFDVSNEYRHKDLSSGLYNFGYIEVQTGSVGEFEKTIVANNAVLYNLGSQFTLNIETINVDVTAKLDINNPKIVNVSTAVKPGRDGVIKKVSIDYGDGNTEESVHNVTEMLNLGFTHEYAEAGNYDLTFCATDQIGVVVCKDFEIQPPVIRSFEVIATKGFLLDEYIQFDVESIDNNSIINATIHYGDGTAEGSSGNFFSPLEKSWVHKYSELGKYVAKVCLKDETNVTICKSSEEFEILNLQILPHQIMQIINPPQVMPHLIPILTVQMSPALIQPIIMTPIITP